MLIGDPDQLPSIGAGQLLRDALQAGTLRHCRLTQVFRQKASSAIIAAATAINRGEFPPKEVCTATPSPSISPARLHITDCLLPGLAAQLVLIFPNAHIYAYVVVAQVMPRVEAAKLLARCEAVSQQWQRQWQEYERRRRGQAGSDQDQDQHGSDAVEALLALVRGDAARYAYAAWRVATACALQWLSDTL